MLKDMNILRISQFLTSLGTQTPNHDRRLNAEQVLISLIKTLNLEVSPSTVRDNLAAHPESPSMLALSDLLSEWNVENLAVAIGIDDLNEIPLPAIAHMKGQDTDYFVLLTKTEGSHVQYLEPVRGRVNASKDLFCSMWDGNTLLISAKEGAGQEDYNLVKKNERAQRVESYILWGLLGVLIASPLAIFSLAQTLLYVLDVVGAILSLVLLQKQLGFSTTPFDVLCKMGNNTDCNAVLQDPRVKLFGVVNLSEVGTLFFMGSLLTSIISASNSTSTELPMLALSTLTLPFTLGLIYYQKQVIRKWCPLCLLVVGVLWVKLVVYTGLISSFVFQWQGFAQVIFSFMIVVFAWMTIRQHIIRSQKYTMTKRELNRFLRNENVFQKLLMAQPIIELGDTSNDLTSGTNEALVTITLVTNPMCVPCAAAHAHVHNIARQFKDQVRVIFKFAIDVQDTQSNAYQIVSHLLGINRTNPSLAIDALTAWYSSKSHSMNFLTWKAKYPLNTPMSNNDIADKLAQQAKWAVESGIMSTPTILLDGQRMPREFSVTELKYHTRKLLETKVSEVEVLS
jgi:uncharacterized membrane protein